MGLCKMDFKIPHKCFGCNEVIQYKQAFDNAFLKCAMKTSLNHIKHTKYSVQKKEFKKTFDMWWKDKRIKLLCCSCLQNYSFNDIIKINREHNEYKTHYDFVIEINGHLRQMNQDACSRIIHAEYTQEIKFETTYLWGVCPKCAGQLEPFTLGTNVNYCDTYIKMDICRCKICGHEEAIEL